MVKVYINNKEVVVPSNTTVLEACSTIGIEVPRFCYHKRLSVAGNCRMCLVEIDKAPKPIASCTFPVSNNLRVFTETPLVKKARENVIEFLLLNHPLDCPICDQAGECDLQDQALFFGSDNSRFFEHKRAVEDKNCGPIIKTIMTRCIHCTRCVRFMSDIAGLEDFGTTNRGQETEIGTYIKKAVQTELSGNIIDLCPVGALTSKPYAFLARPWEIRSAGSIDFSDGFGSNLRIDFKESEIVRVLPKINSHLNEEWLSDKARFNFDGLKIQRLVSPYLKTNKSSLKPISWETGLSKFRELFCKNVKGPSLKILCSAFLDLNTLKQTKNLAHLLGIKNIGFSRKFLINLDFKENFTLSLRNIENADLCLLVGVNPRFEASMLNLKLRKKSRSGLLKKGSVGNPFNLSYEMPAFGISTDTLIKISEGKHPFCKEIRRSKNPLILFSASLCERYDFFGINKILFTIKSFLKTSSSSWDSICFLNQEVNQTGGFSLGLSNREDKRKNKEVVLVNGIFKEEEVSTSISKNSKTIVLSPLGNNSLLEADLILPGNSPLETSGFFMNTEGTVQKSEKVFNAPGLAKESSKLLELIGSLENSPNFPDLFQPTSELAQTLLRSNVELLRRKSRSGKSLVSRNVFRPYFTDFFISDGLSEVSLTMAKCSKNYRKSFTNFILSK